MPRSIEQKHIESFLVDLMKKGEEWRSLKLVVLGNGQIGKTTLIRAIKQLLNLEIPKVIHN